MEILTSPCVLCIFFLYTLQISLLFTCTVLWPRKEKEPRGIRCGGHLWVTYGAELLCLQSFSYLSPPSKRGLTFQGTKSCLHNGYRAVNHAVTIIRADGAEWLPKWFPKFKSKITHPKFKSKITHLHTWSPIWPPLHSVNTGEKRDPIPLFKFLGCNSMNAFHWLWKYTTRSVLYLLVPIICFFKDGCLHNELD